MRCDTSQVLMIGKACVLLLSVMAVGCTAGICDRPEREKPTPFHGGEIVGNTYSTGDFEGDLLHFPGGAFYEIHHGLGQKPTHFAFWLSFERDGLTSGSLALAAGNQVELKAPRTEETFTVLNGSCSEYFLLAQAWVDDVDPDDGAGGGTN